MGEMSGFVVLSLNGEKKACRKALWADVRHAVVTRLRDEVGTTLVPEDIKQLKTEFIQR